ELNGNSHAPTCQRLAGPHASHDGALESRQSGEGHAVRLEPLLACGWRVRVPLPVGYIGRRASLERQCEPCRALRDKPVLLDQPDAVAEPRGIITADSAHPRPHV